MTETEKRRVARHGLVGTADLRLPGSIGQHRVKVRNLSAGGMMAEGPVGVVSGALLEIELPNIGWVPGAVAWVQDDRFGIAFAHPIEPEAAGMAATGGPR
jgi:hypothetical protein